MNKKKSTIEKYDLEEMMKQCKQRNLYALDSSSGTVCTLRAIFQQCNCEYLGETMIAIPTVYKRCDKYGRKN